MTPRDDPGTTTVLLTGATGYVGGQLLPALLEAGHRVRCLVRRPERADLPAGAEVVKGDVSTGAGLAEALEGCDVAYYLVHSMGGPGAGDFVRRDREAAATFGRAVAAAGVGRTIYLGGLESGSNESEHLRSRAEVAEVLEEHVPRLVHVRAAMVIGEGSASFVMLRSLVEKLPAMLTPKWVDTRSQPVAIRDVVGTLTALATFPDPPREVQLGGADVLTYRDMMLRFAAVEHRRPPAIIKVPVLSPGLSSHWVSLFTPIETGLVRPLVEGLGAETIVREPPPAGLNDEPLGFDDACRAAIGGSVPAR
jgi:uncharacterized protein YbjT (DUF2867 family)